MNHMDACIARKLTFEVARERPIHLEEKQLRVRTHPSRNLPRMHPFPRAVLGDHARLAQIHLAGDTFHQRLRAGDDRGDLKWSLQETLKKQCTHEMRIVASRLGVVQSRSNY